MSRFSCSLLAIMGPKTGEVSVRFFPLAKTAWHLRAYASAAGFGSGAWRCAAEVLRMLRSRGLRQEPASCGGGFVRTLGCCRG